MLRSGGSSLQNPVAEVGYPTSAWPSWQVHSAQHAEGFTWRRHPDKGGMEGEACIMIVTVISARDIMDMHTSATGFGRMWDHCPSNLVGRNCMTVVFEACAHQTLPIPSLKLSRPCIPRPALRSQSTLLAHLLPETRQTHRIRFACTACTVRHKRRADA